MVIDEIANFLGDAKTEIEKSVAWLTSRAHKVGIHLVLATQYYSLDFGSLISAGFHGRIVFRIPRGLDLRALIGHYSAAGLFRTGDMLYMASDISRPRKVHGAYISDGEIHAIVNHWLKQGRRVFDNSIWMGRREEMEEAGNWVDPE